MLESPLLNMIEQYLNVTSNRHSLVVANMANIDTPAYQTRDVDFRSELQHALLNPDGTTMPVVRQVKGLLARPDGNNVNLDREGTLLAETQIQYRIGVQLLRSEFHKLMTAINGGNGGNQG